jgi:hypothetical protein
VNVTYFEIRKDGKVISSGSHEDSGRAYNIGAARGHRLFSSSWDWAQRYEGWSLWLKEPGKDWEKVNMGL